MFNGTPQLLPSTHPVTGSDRSALLVLSRNSSYPTGTNSTSVALSFVEWGLNTRMKLGTTTLAG